MRTIDVDRLLSGCIVGCCIIALATEGGPRTTALMCAIGFALAKLIR